MKRKGYVIDYECGNVKSVIKAFEYNGFEIDSGKGEEISNDYLLIIPGVGNFGYAMEFLSKNKLTDVIKTHYESGGKIVGICLGMQLLFEDSEEAPGVKGLGLIKGSVKRLNKDQETKFTKMHLGWSKTRFNLSNEIHDMYYVHQYYCKPFSSDCISETFLWGDKTICAGIKTKQIRAFQFHPEKSSRAGLNLIKNI